MKIKHVILENGDLMSGVPAGLHDHQLREAVAKFANIKGGFNVYRSRGHKLCLGNGVHADKDAARNAGNHKRIASFELVYNKSAGTIGTGNTLLANRGYDDVTRTYVLSAESGQLSLEPYCSSEDARRDTYEGETVVELRWAPNGCLVSVKRVS